MVDGGVLASKNITRARATRQVLTSKLYSPGTDMVLL